MNAKCWWLFYFLKKKKTRYLRPEAEREGPMEGPDLGKPMEMEWFE